MANLQKILVVGPLDRNDQFIGGATVSFRDFVQFLGESRVQHWVVDMRRYAGAAHSLRNLLYTIILTARYLLRCDVVMLHASVRGILHLGPGLYVLAQFFGKRFSLRPFGGDFWDIYDAAPEWHQAVLRATILKAQPLFAQTHAMVARCAEQGLRVVQFPTCRPRVERAQHTYQRRFVFLSRIQEEKGVGVILDALKLLDETFTVDFYGPIADARYTAKMGARYKGTVKPDGVVGVLCQYDVLLLPTFYAREGYPGVIVEALSLGMPVITTRWLAIPEMIDEILIEPRSARRLADAMRSIDARAYSQLCANAAHLFPAFDRVVVSAAVLDAVLG